MLGPLTPMAVRVTALRSRVIKLKGFSASKVAKYPKMSVMMVTWAHEYSTYHQTVF